MPYRIVRVWPSPDGYDREQTMSQHWTRWMARRQLKTWKHFEHFGMFHAVRRGW